MKPITVTHYPDGFRGYKREGGTVTLDECAYAMSSIPHFPLPAITTGCVFFPNYVTLNKFNGKVGCYGPGYESVVIWDRTNRQRRLDFLEGG